MFCATGRPGLTGSGGSRDRARVRMWRGAFRAVLLGAMASFTAAASATAPVAIPQGVWLIDQKAAVQIFDCSGLMCGRILWLIVPRDAEGRLNRDRLNPDPALRERELCGLTIFWGLHPAGPNRWRDGWFYNPDDGKTYRFSAEQKSDDVIAARIYIALPILGKTKTLARVPRGTAAGWC